VKSSNKTPTNNWADFIRFGDECGGVQWRYTPYIAGIAVVVSSPHVYVYIYVYVYVYVCIYVYVYIYVYTSTYTYIYTYIYLELCDKGDPKP